MSRPFEITEITGGAKVEDGKLVLDGISGEFLGKTDKGAAPFLPETPVRPEILPANWLTFHLAHPGPGSAMPGDPNCAFFWKGRVHLHYIYKNEDGFVFAHVSSEDMVHWKWHPTTLTPAQTGHKHMLLCISHTLGCRYYLGEWKDEKFTPDFHARMNWKGWDFFAPESVLTPDGRRVMWAWCNVVSPQSGIQSLPRELSLPEDGVLRIKPLRELERLRYDERSDANLTVKSDVPIRLKDFAREDLELRIFLDKNMIEVFANDRQAAVASHKYPPENLGICLFSKGGEVVVKEVKNWKMKSTYAGR